MPGNLTQLFAELPVATVSAAFFYISLIIIFFSPASNALKKAFFVTTPTSGSYVATYDSLRGLLAMWVAVGHMCAWSGSRFEAVMKAYPGFLLSNGYAVAFFCSLSGLLIYRSVLKVEDADDLHNYIIRRFLRVYPVYIVTTVCAMFFCTQPMTFNRITAEFLMLRSFGYPGYLNPPAWSLYVEVLFYLVIPVIALAFRKRMLYLSGVLIIILCFGDRDASNELALWKFFFAGIFSSEVLDRLKGKISTPVALACVCFGVGLIAFGAYSNSHHGRFLLGWTERNTAAVLAVPIFLVGLSSLPSNPVLNLPLLKIIGASSYSLYLWHPFVSLADDPGFRFTGTGKYVDTLAPALSFDPYVVFILVMLPAALFWAMASFVLIERPCLNLRHKLLKPAKERPAITH